MKKYLLFFCSLILAASCSSEVFSEQPVGDIDLRPSVGKGEAEGLDTGVFGLLNLDYDGLADVKAYCEAEDWYNASIALLDYWRSRPVYNPNSNVLTPSATASEQNIAAQATAEGGWRFHVAVYRESGEDNAQAEWLYWSFAGDDGAINWDMVPAGLEKEKEFLSQKHRLQWMLPQAKTYAVTKDEKYMTAWFEAWKSYNEKFPVPEGQTNATEWSGLQPCCRMNDLLDALPYYLHSENFTPEVLLYVLRTVYNHVESIRQNLMAEETSNIRLTQEQAILTSGILMPEFVKASEWFSEGSNAIARQLTAQFNEDGVHNEFDISYHIGAVADFMTIYKMAQVNGRTAEFPADYLECLRSAAGFVKDVIYPNYSTDNFNDTRSARMTKSVLTRNLRQYSEMFPDDEEMKWVATQGLYGTKPVSTLVTYPVSGYYMMRNGWTSGSTMLVHKSTYDLDKKWHNQSDNGTVSLYVNGRRFLPDAGCYTYNDGSNRRIYASTEMHNVVTKAVRNGDNVEFKNYEAREGKLLLAENNSGYEVLVTENPAYSDLTIRRAIFFVDDKYFVIVDEAYGACADTQLNLNFKLWGGKDAEEGGVKYAVLDDLEGNAAGAHSNFSDNNNLIIKSFSETADNISFTNGTGYFSNEIDTRVQRRWFRLNVDKKAGKAVRFISVLYPCEKADGHSISAEFLDNSPENAGTFHPEGVSVRVTVDGVARSLAYTLK